ncbi:nucleotidyltransferase family protein [Paramicrobacterium chengjingii]|uniref:Nucleotidyltransferase family protein n=1 Tax=Paramicrobacterium chengjingii TaxID=2769067 RepID=A0ABX6YFM7_9MICO|nr:nucleotidyltransferase family protein [Microbacterium chengjingii]QPZ37475.1 nucleotidyltransferase family protein [Microbacterium chengjingii]
MTEVEYFSRQDAVAFAHALVAFVAHERGFRALSIKGFTMSHYGLRAERTYADADVWVDPQSLDALIDALSEYGWTERYERVTARILPDHSRTLIHDQWPCDIDLHWFFPGSFARPDQAFDYIWSSRSKHNIASTPIEIPSREVCTVIGLLHTLRHPDSPLHRSELEAICNAISHLDAEDTRGVAKAAEDLQALYVVKRTLSDLGIDTPEQETTDEAKYRWKIYTLTHDNGSTGAWLYAFRSAPFRNRPEILWRALYPTRQEIEREMRRKITTKEASRYRLLRLAKGVKNFPRAFANIST